MREPTSRRTAREDARPTTYLSGLLPSLDKLPGQRGKRELMRNIEHSTLHFELPGFPVRAAMER